MLVKDDEFDKLIKDDEFDKLIKDDKFDYFPSLFPSLPLFLALYLTMV